jgi:hypothetical protein
MEDPVEVNRRIERLIKRVRRRDDYGELLFSGQVIRSEEDIEDFGEWRAELRKKARADRIKLRTGKTGGKVWAVVHGPLSSAQLLEGERFFTLADRALGEARSHGHDARVVLRDGDEAVIKCENCSAFGYVDAAESIIGGAVFDGDCREGELPDNLDAG